MASKSEFADKFSKGVDDGAQDAKSVLMTTAGKLNVFGVDKASATIAFLVVVLGTLSIIGYATSMAGGAVSGLVNRRPLPVSANPMARLGHAVGTTVGTVGGYTLTGVAASLDQGVRYQAAGYNQPLNPLEQNYPQWRNSDAVQPAVTPYTQLPNGGYVNTTYQYGVPNRQP